MAAVRWAWMVLLILAVSTIQLFSSEINESFRTTNTSNSQNSGLLSIQEQENWLVLPIHFRDLNGNLVGIEESEITELMEADGGAIDYIFEASGGRTLLTYVVADAYIPTYSIGWYGSDNPDRDYLVQDLASETFENINSDISGHDLDGDGVIDRVLLLHGMEPQESGGGPDSIWSHFSQLENEIQSGGNTLQHYTISSIKSGLGTLVHEMMHQMGAYDLYDVHGDVPSRDWNGVGDWGIMASGNWNGGGLTPALPTASTLTIVDPFREITQFNPSVNSEYALSPFSQTGEIGSISISDTETIFVTFRDSTGFDRGLPGDGLLVEYQDRANGDYEENMLNSDPNYPWTYIIEADGNDALRLGDNDGEYTDTFQVGQSFGNSGVEIRDASGKLVPWTISVVDINNGKSTLSLNVSNYSLHSSLPRSPIVLLKNETLDISLKMEESCEVLIQSSFSNSNSDRQELRTTLPSGYHNITVIDLEDTSKTKGDLLVNIGCIGDDGIFNVEGDFHARWYLVDHKIIEKENKFDVRSKGEQTIIIMPEIVGTGTMLYNAHIDGPASQVVQINDAISIDEDGSILLRLNPDELLRPGMLARGDVVLIDNNGIESRLPFVLYTENAISDIPILGWLSIPSNGLSIALALLVFSSFRTKSVEPETNSIQSNRVTSEDEPFTFFSDSI